jgi:hypothetical protein
VVERTVPTFHRTVTVDEFDGRADVDDLLEEIEDEVSRAAGER